MAAPIRYADRVVVGPPADAGGPAAGGAKQFAPAADRNKEPIGDVLASVLPSLPGPHDAVRLLELASGTGQHAAYLAGRFPQLAIQPTDVDLGALASIAQYAAELQQPSPAPAVGTILPPLLLDCADPSQHGRVPRAAFDLALAVNLLHISTPEATPGLLRLAAHALRAGGALLVYGPFMVGGAPTTDSNAAFHEKLRGMDPRFGLRDVGDVEAAAAQAGLRLERRVDMPSNNFMLVLRRGGGGGGGGSEGGGGETGPAP